MHLTYLKYLSSKLRVMSSPRISRFALPLQVAAVCYRRVNSNVEFLLVHTNGGNKWTFPKGAPEPRLSHSQAAEREAKEEAGAVGTIEPRHFHIYVHSKGVFWQPGGVQEYVVKAFLMEVRLTRTPEEDNRDPTWFDPAKARIVLAKGREVKYAHELQIVIDRAMEHLGVARMAAAR
jgi:8-oxo-dGTP pyrophosphatase MutT (NUDIX family)